VATWIDQANFNKMQLFCVRWHKWYYTFTPLIYSQRLDTKINFNRLLYGTLLTSHIGSERWKQIKCKANRSCGLDLFALRPTAQRALRNFIVAFIGWDSVVSSRQKRQATVDLPCPFCTSWWFLISTTNMDRTRTHS